MKIKKVFAVLALALLSHGLFCEDTDLKNAYVCFNLSWATSVFFTPENGYYLYTESDEYEPMDKSNWWIEESGYVKCFGSIVIPGAIDYMVEGFQTEEYKKNEGIFFNGYYDTKYSASSELTEKTKEGTVVYGADNLGKFSYAPDKGENLSWNFEQKPWVEGVKGYGVGESIKLSTKTPFRSIVILNGYVDLQRQDLYKKNSRVKTFKVRDIDNNVEYTFNLEDYVEFQGLYLRNQTKNIELTIVAVYPGEKWDDTCVTGIVPMVNNQTFDEPELPLEQSGTFLMDKERGMEKEKNILSNFKLMVRELDYK